MASAYPVHTASDLGAAVRRGRRAKGLSQAQLADLAGVSRAWVVAVEGGKRTAAVGLVLNVLAALDLRIEVSEAQPPAPTGRPRINLDDHVRR